MSLFTSASLILTPNGYKSQKLYSIVPSNGDGDLACTRATTATRVNSKRLIESVGINIPRLDYSDGIASWLLEPQRTNIIVQSSNFITSWIRYNSATVAANTTIAPDGTQTADTINSAAIRGSGVYQSIGVLAGNIYTFSVYIKNLSNATHIVIGSDSNPGESFVEFNAITGTVIRNGSNLISSKVVDAGNGWYRVSGTYTPNTTTTSPVLYNGSTTACSFAVWGAQLELGSYATSHIPTTTSTVTRNADVVSNTGIGDLIGQREGTLYTEVAPMSTSLGPTTPILYIQSADGTSSLMLYLDSYGSTLKHTLQIIKNGSTGYISDGITITNTNFTKLALRYKVGEISLWKDGIKTFTYTDPTFTAFPFTPQFEKFLTVGDYGSSVLGTKLKGLQFYKTALTDAQCTALTTYNSYAKMAYELNYILQ